MPAVVLDGENVGVEDVVAVARRGAEVRLSSAARRRIERARQAVERSVRAGRPVYGLNTGVGPLKKEPVPRDALSAFNQRLVLSHSAPVSGEELPVESVRAMMVARVNGMARGVSGVRAELVELLVEMLNREVHPVVRPVSGTVGESDLGPMADVGRAIIGHGTCLHRGERLQAEEAFARAGLAPMKLEAKEGLGLISANALTIGAGALAATDALRLLDVFDVAAGAALEGFAANLSILHPDVEKAKPGKGQARRTNHLRALLDGSALWNENLARNIQDPLSFRCIPQVHGACDDTLRAVVRSIEGELNAAEDNPLVSPSTGRLLSNGNFDTTALGIAFDQLRLAIGRLVVMATQRVHKQIWAEFSGLETGLGPDDDRRQTSFTCAVGGSGQAMRMNSLARAAAVLAAQAHLLAHPASLTFEPQLAEGIEDHASMAPLGLKRTRELLEIAKTAAAVELVVASRAVRRRGYGQVSKGTQRVLEVVDRWAPPGEADEFDLTNLVEAIGSGALTSRFVDALRP